MNLYDYWVDGLLSSDRIIQLDSNNESARRTDVDDLWKSLLLQTYETATILRDFRETHGLVMPPTFLLQQTSLATLILLKAFHRYPPPQQPVQPHVPRSWMPVTDTTTAFEECFRCLLACGMQIMFTRGVLRMVYHTALELKVRLPDLVYQMFRIAGEAAWRPADVHGFHSVYHNAAFSARTEVTRRQNGMEALLKKFEESAI